MVTAIVLTVVIGYLLGNLNGSVMISKTLIRDDVRRHGSGNAGFTNFFRSYGGFNSLLVILIDAFKAVAAVLIGGALLAKYDLQLEGRTLGALAVALGHDFPALLGFHGGKGIISSFAALITIDGRIALAVGLVFLAAYLLTFYVSLGSLLGAVTYGTGFVVAYPDHPAAAAMGVIIALLAIYMHRENILRIAKGTERKTNFFKRGK